MVAVGVVAALLVVAPGPTLGGAAIGAGFGIATCHGNFNCIVDSALAGAIGGGAGAAAGGPGLAGAIRGGAVGGLSEAATQQFISGNFDLRQLAVHAAAGAALSATAHGFMHGKPTLEGPSPTVGELRASGRKDAHHIIQDAAVREVPGYKTNAAPGVQLRGPSTAAGTPHYHATQVQRSSSLGGTYGAERQVACAALAAAGYSALEIAAALARSDRYFIDELGLTHDSPLRIPGDRRNC